MKKRRSAPVKKSPVSNRIATKIPNFDRLIEGGFDKNSTNLIVGKAGVGKSIFATQFLVAGIRQGEKVLYVTFEEKKNQFYFNMRRFGWDLAKHEKKGSFTFLEYSPEKVKTMLEEGGGEIENIIIKNKVSRIVIDSITSFALLFDDERDKREAALSLFNMIKKWNCTSLLTYEEETFKNSSSQSQAIEFESDSIVMLYLPMNKNKRERYIEVIKMRGTDHSHNVYMFDIGPKGIKIDKKPSKKVPGLQQ